MWTLQRNSSKRHSRSRKFGEKFRIRDKENHDILWKMYSFMFRNCSKQSLHVLKKLLYCYLGNKHPTARSSSYSLVFLCIPMYFPLFPCIPMYSYVFPSNPLYSLVFPLIPLYSYVLLCIPLYSLVFPYIPLYSLTFQ